MKKCTIDLFSYREKVKKILNMAKIFLFLILISLQLKASYSQRYSLTLKFDNIAVRDLLVEIEKISEYSFIYKKSDLEDVQEISVDFKNEHIESILNYCIEGTNLTYKIRKKHIIIRKEKPKKKKKNKYGISGVVYDFNSKEPIYYATVNLKGTQLYSLTDEKGEFKIENIVEDNYIIEVSILGYRSETSEIKLTKDVKNLKFYLRQSSLALEDITVIANSVQSKNGTSSYKIGTEAIKQVQPLSVSDVLQLMPGAKIGQTGLASPAIANIRNSDEFSEINSFGTSVVVDGNQLSSDANMQNFVGTRNANFGTDLRMLSATNIESVEIISGVASAKYGNITSGTILIKRKIGYSPWNISFNTDSKTYQGSISKGFKLTNGSFINTDLDYAYSLSNAVSIRDYFQRFNLSLRYSKVFDKLINWTNNTSISVGYGFDGKRDDPDEKIIFYEKKTRNYRLMFSNSGSLNLLGNINYSINVNYSDTYNYMKDTEDGPTPIIESLEEGTYLTRFTPISFMVKTESYGNPLNINLKIDNENIFKVFNFKNTLNFGIEYFYDKNLGKGLVIDDKNSVGSTNLVGKRNVNFHEVPASRTLSLYVQDNIDYKTEKSIYLLRLGLRYDYMLNKYNLFSPRLSFSAKYFNKLRLRAAVGISYKAPSMLQLYPGPSYFDVVNLNHYSEDKNKSFAIVTTNIFKPVNNNLKPSMGKTTELGADYEIGDMRIRFTAYKKRIKDGISSFNVIRPFEKIIYAFTGISDEGTINYEPTSKKLTLLKKISNFNNIVKMNTDGIEFDINFPTIKATNTDINISGSYIESISTKDEPQIISSFSTSGSQENRYAAYKYDEYKYYKSNSNFTITQRIPKIKMLVTFITEINVVEKKDKKDKLNIYPIGYYKYDGTYIGLTKEESRSEEYSDLVRDKDVFVASPIPLHFNFHFRLRKETESGHSFSIYANNFLWYNPSYIHKDTNRKRYLNSKISFGIGMNFKF